MFIGIDLGTSELKALLLDAQHRIVASVGEPLTVQQPQPLWREQDPADWWAACDRALQRLRDQHPAAMAQVQALGLSGQMHGAVLIDTVGTHQLKANDGDKEAAIVTLEKGLKDNPGDERLKAAALRLYRETNANDKLAPNIEPPAPTLK